MRSGEGDGERSGAGEENAWCDVLKVKMVASGVVEGEEARGGTGNGNSWRRGIGGKNVARNGMSGGNVMRQKMWRGIVSGGD